jgi:DNA modification methylase
MDAIREAALSRTPVSIGPRRTATPHEYYRYPARFSPDLAAAVIKALTEPGDLVSDYFLGGGTTLVEARMAGRIGVGSDINALSAFVSRVKTRLYSASELHGQRLLVLRHGDT